MRIAQRSLLFAALVLTACTRGGGTTPPTPTPNGKPTPAPFAERAEVVTAIESNRLADAESTLAKAPDMPDVHFLRARLAEARLDTDAAYREIKLAVAAAPGFAEYQYELGVIAAMPGGADQSIASQAGRFAEAGRALDAALAISPDEPKYLYTRAYFLTLADKASGGDPARGRKMFDHILEVAPDSAWSHRVKFDRAADAEKWADAEEEAAKTGDRDAILGSRLWLLVAGTRLRDGKLDEAKKDLEAAAKLNRATATGFCDAGFALDGGGNNDLAHDFWARCLALLPDGPKAPQARVRLEAEKGAAPKSRIKVQ